MDIQTDDSTDVEDGKRIKTIQQSSTAAVDLTATLTPDLLTEILIKLPIRSILKFRCVCKSWKGLISNPIFVKKHLTVFTQHKDYKHHSLIISSDFCIDVYSCSMSSVLGKEPIGTRCMDYPLRSSEAEVWIIGSVNGLICIILDETDLYLWNPATKKSNKLPHCGFKKSPTQHIAYGFGYDEASSDYKVVVISTNIKRPKGPYKTRVKIFRLRSNSWEKIDSFPNCYLLDDSGKFVSGTLHWPASFEMGLNSYQGILAFNLSTETYSEVSQPRFRERFFDSIIGVLNGCLCLLYNFGGEKVDVWVMKEYGKTDSWSKMFSLPFLHDPELFQYSTPLFISRRNEVLLLVASHMVLYNLESNTVWKPVIPNFNQYPEVNTYIKSLVSPYHE